MTLIVQKFGGTSVGDIARIKRVAQHVLQAHQSGNQVIVVVSAMAGETDRLIGLAHQIAKIPEPREYDRLVSTGEMVSSALLAMLLQSEGIKARSLTGADIPIQTTDLHQNAMITKVSVQRLNALLQDNVIPIVAGFQGVSDAGEVTTLGRGGSDITAVAIAASMKANECQIFTDVEGVYTSDPRVVNDAKLLNQITYAEMLAFSRLGAKVLHRRSVDFAKRAGVPVRVLSTFSDGAGTLVCEKQSIELPWVSGVAFEKAQVKLSILGVPKKTNVLTKVKIALEKTTFDIDMSVENFSSYSDTIDISFTVHTDDYIKAREFADRLAETVNAKSVVAKEDIAKLSLVGLGMKSHAGVAAKILQTLSDQDIPIYLIASDEAKISTVIDKQNMEAGAKLLHQAFGLAQR